MSIVHLPKCFRELIIDFGRIRLICVSCSYDPNFFLNLSTKFGQKKLKVKLLPHIGADLGKSGDIGSFFEKSGYCV